MPKKPKRKKITRGHGVPCPECGSPSRVLRTSIGERLVNAKRDHVLRWRRCVSRAHHRFQTEEHAR
jgi:ssDNA-binding Zn-finger/Zn-ribbon topoisomerase 1